VIKTLVEHKLLLLLLSLLLLLPYKRRPGRPMYLHTDDNRLRRMFVELDASISPKPSKLPLV
jgi:hypothetical protein